MGDDHVGSATKSAASRLQAELKSASLLNTGGRTSGRLNTPHSILGSFSCLRLSWRAIDVSNAESHI